MFSKFKKDTYKDNELIQSIIKSFSIVEDWGFNVRYPYITAIHIPTRIEFLVDETVRFAFESKIMNQGLSFDELCYISKNIPTEFFLHMSIVMQKTFLYKRTELRKLITHYSKA